ncbi:hypothetical protein [Granulicatella sp.]
MANNKKWFYGFILLFLGNTLLLRSTEFSIILSIIIILLGHLFIILIGKEQFGLKKIIKSNIVIALVFAIYYFVFNQMQLGLFHNIIIAMITYISFWYLSQAKQ